MENKEIAIILGFSFLFIFLLILYDKIKKCCEGANRSSYSIRKREYASGINPKTGLPYTVDNKAYFVPKVEYAKDHHIKKVIDMYKGVDLGEINSDLENKTYNANWLDVVDSQSSGDSGASRQNFGFVSGSSNREDFSDDSKECYEGCSSDSSPSSKENYLLKNPSGVTMASTSIPSISPNPDIGTINPWRYKQAPVYEMYTNEYSLSPDLMKGLQQQIQELENKMDVYTSSEEDAPPAPPQYLQIIQSRPMSWAPNKNPIYYPHLRRELPY